MDTLKAFLAVGTAMSGARVALAVLLVLPAAGCLTGGGGSSDDPGSGTNPSQPQTDASVIHAPNWSLGDHWTWRSDQVGEVTYAVTGEEGGDWIVDTTNRDVAFFDARFDVSTLGEVRESDLAGSQGDTRVEFFDWPLEENKTWTTTWDGVEREITVDRVEEETAHLTARQDGRLAVEYTYDSEAESFGELVFLDANGTETFGMQLQSSGSDFPGTPVRWSLEASVEEAGTFGAQPASFGFGFTVPEDATDIWLGLSIACPGNGGFDVGFGPSSGSQSGQDSSYSRAETCPEQINVAEPVVEGPSPGDYRGGLTASTPDGEGSYELLLYVRALQEVPVGDG